MKEIGLYRDASGACPFLHWLKTLRDPRAQAKIDYRLRTMETGSLGDCKPVGDGVSEARIHYGPGYRLYFASDGPRLVLLLVGGDKATQTRDIEKARGYWADYKRRKNEHGLPPL